MQGYTIDTAILDDIGAIGALFTESFKDSVLFHCGCLPKPQAAEDIFTLVYETEPKAAFVVRRPDGRVAGYCFALTDITQLWVRAVTHGYILKWCFRWLTGRYGFGFYPVKMAMLNKLAFFRSAFAPGKRAKARILSIAVADNKVQRVRLEVRPDNSSAIKLYERQGFVSAGVTFDPQGEWTIMFKEMEHRHV